MCPYRFGMLAAMLLLLSGTAAVDRHDHQCSLQAATFLLERQKRRGRISERQIYSTAGEKKRQHGLVQDFEDDAKRRAPIRARQLVESFLLKPCLRLAFGQT